MSRPNEHIDEHILAAFLTGNLPAPLRREIASYIAQNERARDLLTMANDAMEVVDSGDGLGDGSGIRLGDGFSHRKRRSPHHRAHVPVSVASQEDESNTTLWKVATLFGASVLLLAITVGVLAFEYRSNTWTPQSAPWAITVSSSELHIAWLSRPDAAFYDVMIRNQETGENVLLVHTTETAADISNFSDQISGRTPYELWIQASDADGEVVGQSEPLLMHNR